MKSNSHSLLFLLCITSLFSSLSSNLIAADSKEKSIKLWPLVQYEKDDSGQKELEILWPLIDYRTTGMEDPYYLLHLLSMRSNETSWRTAFLFNFIGAQGNPSHAAWKCWLFPFLWFGKDDNKSHQVVFPLWFNSKSGDENSRYQSKNRGILFLIWRGNTIYRNDKKEIKREKNYFHIFPFVWNYWNAAESGHQSVTKALFPLYFQSNSEGSYKESRSKSKTNSALFLYWMTDTEREDFKRETNWKNKTRIIFPFYRSQQSKKDDHKKKEYWKSKSRSLWPIYSNEKSQTLNDKGEQIKANANGYLIPLLFWNRRVRDNELKVENFIFFPFYWDMMKRENGKQKTLKAVVPLGAKMAKEEEYKSLNILGPIFTKIDNIKKDYVRYDALFPLFMKKTGKTNSALRIFPLFGRFKEQGVSESWHVIWPFIHSSENSETNYNPVESVVFEDFSSVNSRSKSGTKSNLIIPFWLSYKDHNQILKILFPLWYSDKTYGSNDYKNFGIPLIFSRSKTTRPEGAYSKVGFLLDIIHWSKNKNQKQFHFFPIMSAEKSKAIPNYDGLLEDTNSLSFLLDLISFTKVEERIDLNKPVVKKSKTADIPIIFYAHKKTGHKGTNSKWCFPNFFLNLFDYEKYTNGTSIFKFLNPIYSIEKTAKGETDSKSLGRLLMHNEKDINGFRKTRFLHRIFRSDANSRSSSWELMPFAYGKKNIRDEYNWGILGGLIGAKKQNGKTAIKLFWLPVFKKQYTLEKQTPEQILKQAKVHLENGLKYLESKTPERAMIELRLATPAFNDDPILHEKLGDAFAQAGNYFHVQDHIENIFDEMEYHTSEYPQSLKFYYSNNTKKIFSIEAQKAYDDVIKLGKDTALLQRKIILITNKNPETRDTYLNALDKFPNDYSLNLDAINFAFRLPEKDGRQNFFNQIGGDNFKGNMNKEGRLYLLEQLENKYPNSIHLQYKIGDSIKYRSYSNGYKLDKEKTKKAIRHFLKGIENKKNTPEYQTLDNKNLHYKFHQNEEDSFQVKCIQSAEETIQHLINDLIQKKSWQEAGLWLDQYLELHQKDSGRFKIFQSYYYSYYHDPGEWKLNETIKNAATIFSKIDKTTKTSKTVMPSLVQYLEKRIDAFSNEALKQRWMADLRGLERDLAYITEWDVEKVEFWDKGKNRPESLPEITIQKTPEKHFDQYVDLDKFFVQNEKLPDGLIATLSSTIESKTDRDAVLYFGYDEYASVSLNDQVVYGPEKNKIATIDEFKIPIKLKKGSNKISIQIADKKLAWGFFALIADENGNVIH